MDVETPRDTGEASSASRRDGDGIRLEGVTKVFGADVTAVDDVSLDIADGEFMVLVGPSGCGKSTLLRLIAGLEAVSAGRVFIGSADVTDVRPQDRDLAMVFQNYALYPHMTVAQNLAFGLRLRRIPKAERARRALEVARKLGLEELLDRKPSELSGGQRQRVAMGRAMVREPKAFLMDEPLSNLDAKLRVTMRAELARLHERLGVTTVYVTHDQVEAMTLGHRVAVLRDGVLQQVDTPQRLFREPANLFVASFIGSPSMNLVEAELVDGKLRFGDHALPLAETARLAQRRVILGIRPTDFGDGAVMDPDAAPSPRSRGGRRGPRRRDARHLPYRRPARRLRRRPGRAGRAGPGRGPDRRRHASAVHRLHRRGASGRARDGARARRRPGALPLLRSRHGRRARAGRGGSRRVDPCPHAALGSWASELPETRARVLETEAEGRDPSRARACAREREGEAGVGRLRARDQAPPRSLRRGGWVPSAGSVPRVHARARAGRLTHSARGRSEPGPTGMTIARGVGTTYPTCLVCGHVRARERGGRSRRGRRHT